MKNILLVAFIVLIIILIGLFMNISNQKISDEPLVENSGQTDINKITPQVPDNIEKSYSLEEIKMHDKESDCWFAIAGKVYDVTDYIKSNKHGGGKAIVEGCGKDATDLFNSRPMGSKTPHSDKARSFLPGFEIGILKISE